jgi:hypothetical protein
MAANDVLMMWEKVLALAPAGPVFRVIGVDTFDDCDAFVVGDFLSAHDALECVRARVDARQSTGQLIEPLFVVTNSRSCAGRDSWN